VQISRSSASLVSSPSALITVLSNGEDERERGVVRDSSSNHMRTYFPKTLKRDYISTRELQSFQERLKPSMKPA